MTISEINNIDVKNIKYIRSEIIQLGFYVHCFYYGYYSMIVWENDGKVIDLRIHNGGELVMCFDNQVAYSKFSSNNKYCKIKNIPKLRKNILKILVTPVYDIFCYDKKHYINYCIKIKIEKLLKF